MFSVDEAVMFVFCGKIDFLKIDVDNFNAYQNFDNFQEMCTK